MDVEEGDVGKVMGSEGGSGRMDSRGREGKRGGEIASAGNFVEFPTRITTFPREKDR